MYRRDYLEKLLKSEPVGNFNILRQKFPNETFEMTLVDFSGMNLDGIDLRRVTLIQTNFEGASLINANFQHAYMLRARLARTNAEGGNFSGAQMIAADCRDAKLKCASFERASLYLTDFTGADLTGAHFKGAKKIETANFKGAIVDPRQLSI